jgi:hypothetical protein
MSLQNLITQFQTAIETVNDLSDRNISMPCHPVTYENTIQISLYGDLYNHIIELEYNEKHEVTQMSLLKEDSGFYDYVTVIFINQNKPLVDYVKIVLSENNDIDDDTNYENELMPDNSHYEGEWLPYRSNNR